jgi:hypothetical protein
MNMMLIHPASHVAPVSMLSVLQLLAYWSPMSQTKALTPRRAKQGRSFVNSSLPREGRLTVLLNVATFAAGLTLVSGER